MLYDRASDLHVVSVSSGKQKTTKVRQISISFWTNLVSLISINLDVKARNWHGNDIEWNNNGMISSVFICYDCA